MKPKIDLERLKKLSNTVDIINLARRPGHATLRELHGSLPGLITALEEAKEIIKEVDGYGYKGTKKWLAQFTEEK